MIIRHCSNLGWVTLVVLCSLVLGACGSGGEGSGGGESSPANVATVATVEIQQTGLVLTESGATRQLSAVAYDAQGNPLDASFSWTSTTPADIDVDGSGKVTAKKANGASQIVAEANGVKSAPLLVVVTLFPANAIPLTDAQIVGDPVETDPQAEPSFLNTYKVVLTGVSGLTGGELLINTESKPVGGRVVNVETAGGQTTVTLRLVSLREMFPDLNINETIDLSRAPVEINPELAASYDFQRSGNTFTFTPKPAAAPLQAAALAGAASGAVPVPAATPVGTHALPPFTECETSLPELPITLGAPPLFSVSITPTIDLVITRSNGFEHLIVAAEPEIRFSGGVNVIAEFEGKLECKVEIFTFRIPVGGVFSMFVSGLVPVGVGMEVGGKVTVASVTLGSDVVANTKVEVGVNCPNGTNCEFVRSGSGSVEFKPVWSAPSLANLRFEPSLAAFGYVEADIGNPFLRKLRFEAFEAKLGGTLAGSFAPQTTQILDTSYKSDYKVSFELSASAGPDLGEVAKLLGLSSIAALKLTVSSDIAKSPAAAAANAVTADRADFVSGDQVNFHVKLDPGTVSFLPVVGPYNVKEVVLVRKSGTLPPAEVARVSVTAGQTEFDIPFTAPDSGNVDQFTAFTITTLLPFDVFSLEIGTAAGPPPGATLTAQEKYVTKIERTDGPSTIRSSQTRTYTVSYTLTLVQSTSNTGWQIFDFTVAGGNATYEDKYDYFKFTPGQGSGDCTYDETIEDHYVSTGSAPGAGQVELFVASDGTYDIDIMQDGQVGFTKNGVWTAHYDFTGTDNTCRTQIDDPYTNTDDVYVEISSEGTSTPGQTTTSGSELITTGNISDWGGETTMTKTWTLTLPPP